MKAAANAPRMQSQLLWQFALLCTFTVTSFAFAAKPYQHFLLGNAADVTLPSPQTPSLVLMGASTDVDAAFQWMIQKAGGGNFVIIRAEGTDAYNPYIFAMGGVTSVETLIIPSREAANDPLVVSRIRGAEALFIAGGDQSDYVNYWKGTLVDSAIAELSAKNVPIGGTSAGLAIMGQYAFAALNGPISSAEALANPFHTVLILNEHFLSLPYMNNVITDARLGVSDRMGRLVTFLARIVGDSWSSPARGIGIDEETALLVDNGRASKVGKGSVYFLQTLSSPQVLKPQKPLTYLNIGVQRLSGTGSFDVINWSGYGGTTVNYSISAINGVLSSTQVGSAIY
ncbi:MAG: cyanophycinase [Nitrosospira sp.]